MTGPLESALESLFRGRVRAIGGIVVKIAPTLKGVPDRMVLLPGGKIYLVELKKSDGRVSSIQGHFHERAAGVGVTVHVLEGREEIIAWVRDRANEGSRPDRPHKRRRPPVAVD